MKCTLCPRACGADRSKGRGYCGAPDGFVIGRAALHFWEEPVLAPNGKSGAVFFAGCQLGCVYCQNYGLSRGEGYPVTEDGLIDTIKKLEDEGAENIEFVTGSHYAEKVAALLRRYRPSVPTVWNCGGYESERQIAALDGLIDVYMPDFKYSDPAAAAAYSNAPDYPEVAKAAIAAMKKQVGATVVENGKIKKGLLVRHLVLPGAVRNTFGVLDALAEITDGTDILSLMSQYVPYGRAAEYPEINRRLRPLEYKAAVAHAVRLGFANVFIQESSSADEAYIPEFARS